MSYRIMIVDDEVEVQKLITKALKNMGKEIEILTAKKGEEAVTIAAERCPDLVILDISLPGMDGIEACKKIKEATEGDCVVIVITGLIAKINLTKARAAGADDYIIKTSDFKELIEIVRKYLEA